MKKVILSLVCLLILSNYSLFASPFHGGDGTSSHPYQINNETELLALVNANNSSTWSSYFILTNDITCSTSYTATIGNESNGFTGNFDGQNHTISNLTMNVNIKHVGLFGATVNATITNLVLSNVNITNTYTSGVSYTAGLIGLSTNITVSNCSVSGVVRGYSTVSTTMVAGLIAYNFGGGTISNCHTDVNVSGSDPIQDIGGLIGYNDEGTVSNCSSTGNVTGTSTTDGRYLSYGGLIGYNYQGNVNNSYSTGNVIGIANGDGNIFSIGGLIGYNESVATNHCYATGNVSGTITAAPTTTTPAWIGGLIGYQSNGSTRYCNATGNITGYASSAFNSSQTVDYAGGMIGGLVRGLVSHCISTGNVYGDEYCGGFVGESNGASGNSATISNCYSTGYIYISTNSSFYSTTAGGFVSKIDSYNIINNCYTTGNVAIISGVDNSECGGFLGYNGINNSINNCYSTGAYIGTTGSGATNGGFCGYDDGGSMFNTYSCCYWDTETSHFSTGNGFGFGSSSDVIGLTTAQMKTGSIFTTCGWLLTDWAFNANAYPQLLNMPSIPVIITTPTLTEWSRYILIFSVLLFGCYFVYRKLYV